MASVSPPRRRRGYQTFGHGLAVACVLFASVWLFARLLAEHWSTTQAAAWIPTEWVLLLCTVLVAAARILHRAARPAKPPSRWLRAGLVVVALLGLKTAWDWNLHRLAMPTSQPDLRLAYVNLSAQTPESWPVLDDLADVLVIANRPYSADLEPAWVWVDAAESDRDAAIIGRCAIMTGLRVRRYAMTHVQFADVWPEGESPEPGWAAWVELDRPGAGPIVLWVLDLPSPISISRSTALVRTLESVRDWRGSVTAIDDQGLRTSQPSEGFPMPDLVVGDFNTPRWSGTLSLLQDQFDVREVSSAAGVGPSSTFPSPWSFWPIDLCFAHKDWRPVEHDTVVVPSLRHRAITVGIRER